MVLIPVTNTAFVIRQFNWANAIEKTTHWKSVVYCMCPINEALQIVDSKGIKRPSVILEASPRVSSLYAAITKAISWMSTIPYTGYIRFLFLVAKQTLLGKSKIKEIRSILRRHSISAVLMSDASPAYFAPFLAFAARKEHVNILTNPLDRDSPENYALIYKSDSSLSVERLIGKIISRIFPKWVIEYENKRILRITPYEILSQEILGIAPAKPWDTFGCLEDIVVLANETQREFYEKFGIRPDKMSVVGIPELDYLQKVLVNRSMIFTDVDKHVVFTEDKPVILCALPQTHWISGREEAEFQNHNDMIDVWINCLSSQSKYNIVISLHPSMSHAKYKRYNRSNLQVAKVDILNLLPFCSAFVASVSSTIQFAIALGKPVINYDVYRYTIERPEFRFNDGKGTVTILNRKNFEEEINKLVYDNGYHDKLLKSQQQDASNWGCMDGKCVSRFIKLLDSLK